jgi:hypothetical protein
MENQKTASACTKCGKQHTRKKPSNREPEEYCKACDQALVAEVGRIAEHYERHPDECCCHTYLGRDCCMSPIHGDMYRALCIEHGNRFYADLRARSPEEAWELAQECARGWGGECYSVRGENKEASVAKADGTEESNGTAE